MNTENKPEYVYYNIRADGWIELHSKNNDIKNVTILPPEYGWIVGIKKRNKNGDIRIKDLIEVQASISRLLPVLEKLCEALVEIPPPSPPTFREEKSFWEEACTPLPPKPF
jgi:hypothetical protein